MGSHGSTLLKSTSDIFLQLLFINVLLKGFFYFDFLFQKRLCGTDKATAVYYDKTREGNYEGKIQL